METNRQNYIRRIAERIDDLIYGFDTYDYLDCAESLTDPHAAPIDIIFNDLVNKKTADINGYLDAIIEYGTKEDAEEAKAVIRDLDSLYAQKGA